MEAGERAIEQAVAATLASKGLPLTGSLLFWVSQVSIHMVLVGHSPEGIRLMEKAVADAATFLPRMSMFARFLLSMVLCASGEYVRARSLLPENAGDPNWAMSINSGWVRALLIKTGEPAAAAALLRRLLDLASGPAADAVTKGAVVRAAASGREPLVAIPLAGLAQVRAIRLWPLTPLKRLARRAGQDLADRSHGRPRRAVGRGAGRRHPCARRRGPAPTSEYQPGRRSSRRISSHRYGDALGSSAYGWQAHIYLPAFLC